jgi:hypothetical protein
MRGTGIQLDGNYELTITMRKDIEGKIISGLTIGKVTEQNQALLLLCQKGEIKHSPLIGIGINGICNDNDLAHWKREITEQIEGDGQRITKLILTETQLALEAKY